MMTDEVEGDPAWIMSKRRASDEALVQNEQIVVRGDNRKSIGSELLGLGAFILLRSFPIILSIFTMKNIIRA